MEIRTGPPFHLRVIYGFVSNNNIQRVASHPSSVICQSHISPIYFLSYPGRRWVSTQFQQNRAHSNLVINSDVPNNSVCVCAYMQRVRCPIVLSR